MLKKATNKLNLKDFFPHLYTTKSHSFSMMMSPQLSDLEKEKALMRRLYSKKMDDSFFSDQISSLVKKHPAFIVYKGEIRMDYFAKYLNDYNVPYTVINLDYNPVFNEAFSHFYPYVNKSKYLLFFKGKLADTDEFLNHIDKDTVEEYLKSNNLI
jgi:hypothetical protein